MKPLIVTVLLVVLGASLLEAASLEDFRDSFNKLGEEIDEHVKVLRAENGDEILEMNRKMLRLLGNYTNELRDVVYYANTSIQLEDWLNDDPEAQECFDWAKTLLNLYATISWYDLGFCSVYAHRETSIEAQDFFYSHAHYIMRAGTGGRGMVLESFGRHTGLEQQLEFLTNEQEWLQYLWNNYKTVLKQEIEDHEARAEHIAEMLNTCLQQVMVNLDGRVEYVNTNMKTCLANIESPGTTTSLYNQ